MNQEQLVDKISDAVVMNMVKQAGFFSAGNLGAQIMTALKGPIRNNNWRGAGIGALVGTGLGAAKGAYQTYKGQGGWAGKATAKDYLKNMARNGAVGGGIGAGVGFGAGYIPQIKEIRGNDRDFLSRTKALAENAKDYFEENRDLFDNVHKKVKGIIPEYKKLKDVWGDGPTWGPSGNKYEKLKKTLQEINAVNDDILTNSPLNKTMTEYVNPTISKLKTDVQNAIAAGDTSLPQAFIAGIGKNLDKHTGFSKLPALYRNNYINNI